MAPKIHVLSTRSPRYKLGLQRSVCAWHGGVLHRPVQRTVPSSSRGRRGRRLRRPTLKVRLHQLAQSTQADMLIWGPGGTHLRRRWCARPSGRRRRTCKCKPGWLSAMLLQMITPPGSRAEDSALLQPRREVRPPHLRVRLLGERSDLLAPQGKALLLDEGRQWKHGGRAGAYIPGWLPAPSAPARTRTSSGWLSAMLLKMITPPGSRAEDSAPQSAG